VLSALSVPSYVPQASALDSRVSSLYSRANNGSMYHNELLHDSNDLIICIIYASPIKERTNSMFIHDFRLFIFNLKCFFSFILCNQFSQSILLNDPNSSTICFKIGRSLFRESSSFKAISSIILSAICLPLDTINDD
jgi:hypothetical protein